MSLTYRMPRSRIVANPFNRFAGTKAELLTAGSAILSWDYARASKDDHKLGKSVGEQTGLNRANIDRHGWSHGKSWTDNDLGASRQAKRRGVVREEFEKLLAAIRNGEPGDVLVMWELSRRERDMAVFIDIRDLCIEYGPFFWLVGGELYDVRNRHDRSSLGIQAMQAEGGADAIEAGVRRGLEANAMEGKPHGPTPFGYRRIYHPRTRKFAEQVPDWDTFYHDDNGVKVRRIDAYGKLWSPAGVMQEMYEDALACVPLKTIAAALTARGIPTPKHLASIEQATPFGPERWAGTTWAQNVVRRTLLNPANIGIRMSHGEVAKDDCWQELVAAELFYALHNMLTDASRTYNPYAGRPQRALYLTSRLARCWICKGYLAFSKARTSAPGGAGSGDLYKCENNCCAIPRTLLDETVADALIYRLADPTELAALLALDSNAPEIQAARAGVERLRADLADTKARIRVADREDMDDLEARRGDQRRRLALAEAQVVSADMPQELAQFVGTSLDEAAAMWSALLLPAQRVLIRTVVDIWVFPAGRGRGHAPLEERLFIESVARVGASRSSAWGDRCQAARDARDARRSSGVEG